jgi:hypothetical protein
MKSALSEFTTDAPLIKPDHRCLIGGSSARISETEPEKWPSIVPLGSSPRRRTRLGGELSERTLRLGCLRLAQTHSVSGEKLDAGSLERVLHIEQS